MSALKGEKYSQLVKKSLVEGFIETLSYTDQGKLFIHLFSSNLANNGLCAI